MEKILIRLLKSMVSFKREFFMNQLQKHIIETISEINKLDLERFKNVNLNFSNYPRVVFCTMGKSAFACRKAVYTARSYGLDWHDLDVCHAFHGDAGLIKPGDLLFFVSKSGETRETIDVASYFNEWNTVSITSDPNSTLSKMCKQNIDIPVTKEGSPFGYAPMISTTLYMTVIHGLLCKAINENNITIEQYAKNHPSGKIGKDLKDNGI